MNREIKFRVWKTNLKCFAIFDLNFTSDILSFKDCINCTVETIQKDINENSIITQFTGLTDKHGKEIYEGDILKAHGLVAWNDVEHRWSAIDLNWNDNKEWHDIDYLTSPFEVIGNVFENPELLK